MNDRLLIAASICASGSEFYQTLGKLLEKVHKYSQSSNDIPAKRGMGLEEALKLSEMIING